MANATARVAPKSSRTCSKVERRQLRHPGAKVAVEASGNLNTAIDFGAGLMPTSKPGLLGSVRGKFVSGFPAPV